jgi:hypothetical protein
MKKTYLTLTAVIFILISSSGLHAQTIQTKLNQVELMKQFIGSWTCTTGKDTTAIWDFKSFGTGLECYVKYITKGEIFREVKSLYGYDKSSDKFIAPGMVKGMGIEIFAIWFLSDKNYEIIYYSDIQDPEKASIKTMGEINSPDKLVVTKLINNKPVSTLTYTRIK